MSRNTRPEKTTGDGRSGQICNIPCNCALIASSYDDNVHILTEALLRRIVLALLSLLFAAPFAQAANLATTRPISTKVQVRTLVSNTPVEGATVKWETDSGQKGSGYTDSRGNYVVENIPGTCRWISVKIYKVQMVPLMDYWNAPPATNDSPRPQIPPFIFLMEPGGRIGGHVLDENGDPISGAKVYVSVRKKYPGSSQHIDINWQAVTTDPRGIWAVTGVPLVPDSIEIGAYDLMHLDSEFFDTNPYTPLSALFNGTASITLHSGSRLSVKVLKPDGSPAPGAQVFFGGSRNVVNCYSPAITGPDGIADFGCKPGVSAILTATLAGYGPVEQSTVTQSRPQQVTLSLTLPNTRSIQLVDRGGNPVAHADVIVSRWRRMQTLDVELKSDQNGLATWKDSPGDDVEAEIFASGYTSLENFTWPSGKSTRVTLFAPTPITGIVTDAATGRPIQNFSIRGAVVWQEGQRMVWQDLDWCDHATRKQPGRFIYLAGESFYRLLLRVQADDYLPDDSTLFPLDGNPRAFTFKLTKANSVRGKILSAGGHAVPGADVCLVASGDWIQIENGKIPEYRRNACAHTLSSADGSFTLPPQKDDFALIVLAEQGSATRTRSQLNPDSTIIRLTPWAKINGTIYLHGKPAANTQVNGQSTPIALPGEKQVAGEDYQFTTRTDGTFELTRVFPGNISLVRWIPNFAPQRQWNITLVSIDARPGETYELHPGQGTCVTGRLLIPQHKQWMVRQGWLKNPGAASTDNIENVEIASDGTFRSEGLTPGKYRLHIALHEFPPNNECGWGRVVGVYDKQIVIPPNASEVDVGTITPQPQSSAELRIGDIAPDFSVTTLDGKTLRLSELKGKIVLLDFWASWCAPCMDELANMKAIAASHASDSDFVLLSLSEDEKLEDLKYVVKYDSINWPQAWIGMNSAPVLSYGATAIPATFLIGKDGHIIARDPRSDDLKKTVAAALSK